MDRKKREDGQLKLDEFGTNLAGSRKNRFPLQGTCHSCGRQAWLTWIVAEKFVCSECKKDLAG